MEKQLRRFKIYFARIIDLSKYPAVMGSFFGMLYLFSYTAHESIPFPLELSVLPTLLIAVGFVAIFFVWLTVFGLLIPSMVQGDASNIEFLSLFAELSDNGQVIRAKPFKYKLFHYFFAFFLPAASISLEGWHQLVNGLPMAPIIPLLIIAALLLGCYSLACNWLVPKQLVDSDKTFLSKSTNLFFSFLQANLMSWSALGLFLLVTGIAFPEFFRGKDALLNSYPMLGFSVILLFFFLLNFLSVVPFGILGQLTNSPKTGKPEIRLNRPIPIAPFILLTAATIGSVITPSVSNQIGGAALRVLGIGGGIPENLCFQTGQFPNALRELESSDQMDCTCNIWVLFDAGNTIYVKGSGGLSKVYAIRKDGIVVQQREMPKKKQGV